MRRIGQTRSGSPYASAINGATAASTTLAVTPIASFTARPARTISAACRRRGALERSRAVEVVTPASSGNSTIPPIESASA